MESPRTARPRSGKVPFPVLAPVVDEPHDKRVATGAWTPDPRWDEPATPLSQRRSRDAEYTTSPYPFFLLAFVLPLVLLIGATVLMDIFG